mmetsp:Transcript_112928/g.258609  ORF Transcript_112928/g.258609 Transcript_112928/m.258609 type:complete len:138 (+) Transcript_112928:1013-1426(+)
MVTPTSPSWAEHAPPAEPRSLVLHGWQCLEFVPKLEPVAGYREQQGCCVTNHVWQNPPSGPQLDEHCSVSLEPIEMQGGPALLARTVVDPYLLHLARYRTSVWKRSPHESLQREHPDFGSQLEVFQESSDCPDRSAN